MSRTGSIVTGAALGFLTLFSIGCGGNAPPAGNAAEAPAESDSLRAEALFEEQACNVCHGDGGAGIEGAGPALENLDDYWTEDLLEAYLRDPESFREAHPEFDQRRDETYELEMPAFEHLEQDERRLLARWLLAR
jgi:mono/diheme cytochrome c family protein